MCVPLSKCHRLDVRQEMKSLKLSAQQNKSDNIDFSLLNSAMEIIDSKAFNLRGLYKSQLIE